MDKNEEKPIKKHIKGINRYKKGARREDWVTNQLSKVLPFAIGTPGSHSPFDVIATDYNYITLWVQVKSNDTIGSEEEYALAEISKHSSKQHHILLVIVHDCKKGQKLIDNIDIFEYYGVDNSTFVSKIIVSKKKTWSWLIKNCKDGWRDA